jgi:hypothetical protein
MKKSMGTLVILLTLACLALSCSKKPEPEKKVEFKRYEIQSGILEFDVQGVRQGTETLSFDDWGMREARYSKMQGTVGETVQDFEQLTVMAGEWITGMDLKRKEGIKSINTVYVALKQGVPPESLQSMVVLGPEMMQRLGGQKIGSETIAGQTCELWSVPSFNSKSCIWKGIVLMMEVETEEGKIRSEARSIQENVGVDPKRFEIPEGIEVIVDTKLQDFLKVTLDEEEQRSQVGENMPTA